MASSGYAPGWLADYATVASALKANYSAVAPFEASDVVIGITYLRDQEREKRAASGPDEIHRADAEGVLGPGPSASELLDLRKLCVAVEASYLEDRASVAAAIAPLGHAVVVSKPESKFQQPAYFVSRDDATGDVHLVVRGTASLTDALTDMDCDAEPLFADGPTEDVFRAHRGMAAAARWIVAETKEVVAMAMETALSAKHKSTKKAPRLTVLGHSLGAGTAALAAAILKRDIPALRCVAFATPPCLELDAAESCAPFLTSVVLHDDVVSRASLANVQDLRARLQAIDWRASFARDTPRLQSATRAVGGGADKMGEAVENLQRRTTAAAEKGAAFAAAAAAKLFSKDGKDGKGGKGGGGKVAAVAGVAAGAASGAATAAAAAAGSLASRFGASLRLGGAKSADPNPAGAAEPPAASPPPPLFVPGRVFHLRRDAAGAGASSARVSRHVGTLARVELSSSLVADHSLAEYGEALETLALRAGAKTSPRVEVAGPLEWREVNPHVDRLNRNAPLVAALGGLAVSGPIGAIAAGGAAMYAANQRGARDAAKEALERNASRWTSREKCFVLAHETCLKIESAEPGELRPTKIQLFFGNDAKRRFAVRLVESGDPGDSGDSGDGEDAIGGESVIEIYEPEDEANGEAIRVRVPGGGAGVDAWLKALDRCCRGERGDPKPAALA